MFDHDDFSMRVIDNPRHKSRRLSVTRRSSALRRHVNDFTMSDQSAGRQQNTSTPGTLLSSPSHFSCAAVSLRASVFSSTGGRLVATVSLETGRYSAKNPVWRYPSGRLPPG
jgi:hypothetical protein